MSNTPDLDPRTRADLETYFGLTTNTALPSSVATMRLATLRRPRRWAALAGGAAILVVAAVAALIALGTRPVSSPLLPAATMSPTPVIQQHSPSPMATATDAPTPTSTPVATAVATPRPLSSCLPQSGGGGGRASITDMTVTAAGGRYQVIVAFTGAVPVYSLSVNPNGVHFTGSASGRPINVAGTTGLHLQFHNVDSATNHFSHGTDVIPAQGTVAEVTVTGDFEGVTDIGIGLRGTDLCPATTVAASSQLVLDFPGS